MEIDVQALLIGDRVLASHWLAMNLSFLLHYSGFQAVFAESLPSNGHIRHNIFADW
jgi:hypothetical protein